MLDILRLIYKGNRSGVKLWTTEGKLKTRFPKTFDDKALLTELSGNKAAIIDVLKDNEIDTADFKLPHIYQSNDVKGFPLSFAQERLWFVEKYEQGTNAYHIPLLVGIKSDIDQDKLQRAITDVVQRHELLRTHFTEIDGQCCLRVTDEPLAFHQYSHVDTDIKKQLKKDINRPFDLHNECPIRVCFYHTEQCTNLLINIHHIASDGWSMNILLQELSAHYQDKILPDILIRYKDFAFWQRDHLRDIVLKDQLEYWQKSLQGFEPLALPLDKSRPLHVDYHGADHAFVINELLSEKLRALAHLQGCTMYTLLLSGFYILLSKYTGQQDIVLGAPIANRQYSQVKDLIGIFVNTLALREHVDPKQDAIALIVQLQKNLEEAHRHQDLPFEQIVEALAIDKDTARHPLFQVMYSVQTFADDAENKIFDASELDHGYNIAKYDLSCFMDDSTTAIKGSFNYATALFEVDTIKRMANHYELVLQQMVDESKKPIKDYQLLLPREYQQIVVYWNETAVDYPKDCTIYQLFERQVVITPDNIAAVCEGQSLSYAQLNAKANQLAAFLQNRAQQNKQPIKPDTLIALCLDRSVEMIIGILAVMKAGGAYVPIDPEFPSDRICYILEDTATTLLLSQSHLLARLESVTNIEVVALDDDCYDKQPTSNLAAQNVASDLAYVIYTSGTTGRPKGAVVNHQMLVNRLLWQKQHYGFDENDRVLQKTPYVFDVSVWELLLPLISGSQLVFAKVNGHKDPQYLLEAIEHYQITKLHFVPSMLNAFYEHINLHNAPLSTIQQVFCSGEALPLSLVREFKSLFPKIIINNLYGPTEVAIDVSAYDDIPVDAQRVHIGKPIQNIKFYVLDDNRAAVPVGVVGELYISGADFSRGYLNRPDLSSERFINNAFADENDRKNGFTKLYKTGDLVRWLPDGNVEYLGRNDFQIKIRGLRIELGEIEQALTQVNLIKQACVLAKKRNDSQYLVAYYLSENEIKPQAIIKALAERLPEYMIPSVFVPLANFPITVNGKLNRKLLPEPEFSDEAAYLPPTTLIQQQLCKIFQQILVLEQVGISDDFFKVGGNSMSAIKLASLISKTLDSTVLVSDIFKHKTIASLAVYIQSNDIAVVKIPRQNRQLYPLSFAQERLWFIEQYEQGTNAYHIPLLVKLRPNTDLQKLKKSVLQVIERHEVLRTSFSEKDGQYYQRVSDKLPAIKMFDDSNIDLAEQIASDINTPFDLQHDFPIRVVFYQDQNHIKMLINIHHIASDGWSSDILLQELNRFYHDEPIAEMTIQYKDYAYWQRDTLQGEVLQNQLDYWLIKLRGFEPLALPTDNIRPKIIDYTGADCTFTINETLSQQLRSLSKQQGCTLYTTLLSGFYILLSKYTGQDDLVVGSPIANRHHADIQTLIGFFVNSLALRTKIAQNNSVVALIEQVQQNLSAAQQHQDLPFEKVVEALDVVQDPSRHPVFQVMFSLQSFGNGSQDRLFTALEGSGDYAVAKYDLSCFMDDSQTAIEGTFNFSSALYNHNTILRMTEHYLSVLQQMVEHTSQNICDYSLLSTHEYQQIAVDWQGTQKHYPRDKTIHQLFEAQVKQNPDCIAIVYRDEQLSYSQLNAKANQLAHYLQSQMVIEPDELITLCLPRSPQMVIAILAVLKAGGAYVPVDPKYPAHRIEHILSDTQSQLILTDACVSEKLQQITDVRLIDLDVESYFDESTSHLDTKTSSTDLAYVIYTSGTTGLAKGVLIDHCAVVNLLYAMQDKYPLLSQDAFLFKTNYCFDVSVGELFGWFFSGGSLVILPNSEEQEPAKILAAIETHQITHINFVPSMFAVFLDEMAASNTVQLNNLKYILLAGEALPFALISRFQALNTNTKLINAYGPTEGTVYSSDCDLHSDKYSNRASIGKALTNVKLYVVDKFNNLQPQGIVGELCIGGAGLARGYHRQSAYTAAKFIANPFIHTQGSDNDNSRLYKTGDLVRWLDNGELEYIGRNDFQVKVNGYRIETGEIEQVITGLKPISQACVLVNENNSNKYLAAYYVTENNTQVTEAQVLQHLSQHLPAYMKPAILIQLSELPLTSNGKLDRKALPAPEFKSSTAYIAPVSKREVVLCDIFETVLGLEKVGLNDNFFTIGGNSIMAIKLSHKINSALAVNLMVADVFRHSTVTQLAAYLASNTTPSYEIKCQSSSHYPLSFAQQRLWFIEKYEQGSNAYHIPIYLRLLPTTDKARLSSVIEQIVLRHEILRTVFIEQDGQYQQSVTNNAVDIKTQHYQQIDIDKQLHLDVNQPFDLQHECPLRVRFYQQKNHINLLINIHHIATDGWSLDILIKEIDTLYANQVLPELAIQYKDFSCWQRTFLSGEHLQTQADYWHKKLQNFELLAMPCDKPRPKHFDYAGAATGFSINHQLSDKLRALSRQQGCTLYHTMLSGFYILLSKYSGQNDLLVGTPTANRHYHGVEDLIGFFVNTLALRAQLEPQETAIQLMAQVKDTLSQAQQYQDIPFEKVVDILKVEQDTTRHPIFQVMFSVQSFGGGDNTLFEPQSLGDTYAVAKFDLSCFIDDSTDEIQGSFNFATALYHRSTIDMMAEHYIKVLTQMVCAESKQLSEYELLTAQQYQQIVVDWNQTDVPLSDNTLHQLFEQQVVKSPHAIALVFSDESISYTQLNARANQLARYLQSQTNIAPDDLIALYLDRSIDMMVSILAVLKTGGCYVPLDINYPLERIQYILQDTQASLVLTHSTLVDTLDYSTPAAVIALDFVDYLQLDSTNLANQNQAVDLAYVIYTSGTTGKPKGVAVEHRAVVNRIRYMVGFSNITSEDCYIFNTNMVFDVSVSDIFCHWLAGATLVVTVDTFALSELQSLLASEKTTSMHLVPSQYELLHDDIAKSGLNKIYFSGEKLSQSIIKRLPKNLRSYNYYGPTELGEITAVLIEPKNGDSIGKVFTGNKAYILDKNNKICLPGSIGELHVSGVGLAREYLNQPELTQQKFISNPFADKHDISNGYDRLYKTGDLVRWCGDGQIQYIGRNDLQIKIRGFRVELAEIENVLARIEHIKQTVVLAIEQNNTMYLVAYYATDEQLTQESLIEILSQQLPDYMIPSCFIALEQLPLTSNGKLNRSALPAPEFDSALDYVAPVTALQIKLCAIFQDVLGLDKVGIKDDFFKAGGNSIMAIKLSHKIGHALNQQVLVADIFSYKTVNELANHLETNEFEQVIIEAKIWAHYPLSFAQERLWFIEQYEQGTNAYHIPILVELAQQTDPQKLAMAIEQLVQRHEVLRTVFNQKDGGNCQIVLDEVLRINHYYDTDNHNDEGYSLDLQIKADINTPFDLSTKMPIRVSFYHGKNHTRLLINVHHIATDGWSTDIMLQEIQRAYEGKALTPLTIQYKDFSCWQRTYLQGEVLSKQVDYWQNKLSNYQPLELPIDRTRPKKFDYSGQQEAFSIDRELSACLRTLSKQQGCTMYTTLLSGFYILLSKYSSQDDIIIGTPIANRHYRQTKDLIGFFVNSLALRETIDQNKSVYTLMEQVQSNLAEAQRYQDLPFEQVVDMLDIEQDTSRHPIFQVMFTVQSFGGRSEEKGQLFNPLSIDEDHSIAKYDLSCFIDDSNENVLGSFNFATALYDIASIKRMISHYLLILQQMVNDNAKLIKDYNLLSDGEYQQIVVDWNPVTFCRNDQSIPQLFEQQVLQTPDNIALVFGHETLTYAGLNAKANQLARYLHTRITIKPDCLIALCAERSIEMVIGILGILKAGAAYVPIDPQAPADRVSYILDDTQASLVLSQSHLSDKFNTVDVIVMNSGCYQNQQSHNLPVINKASDLAYIIYTSGTTGMPKGVQQLHGNVQRLFGATQDQFAFSDKDVWTLYHSITFDFSVWEIWGALTFGGKLVIPEQQTIKDIPRFVDLCIEHKVTVLNQTPAAFYAFCDSLKKDNIDQLALNFIIFGGDALNTSMLAPWWQLSHTFDFNARLINMYGITETTVHVTYKELVEGDKMSANIGKVLCDLTSYVLDANGLPVPVGVPGELHIGGAGLARGYLNQPQLTAQKFIDNPFVLDKGEKLYKTSDLVRWLPNGDLQYLGRNDFQVKIRGYRIELGEIENAIVSIDYIKQACVLVKENSSGKHLVAYYVSDIHHQPNSEQNSENEIINLIAQQLPDYMIPSVFVSMTELPITINGKLDRRALPEPQFTHKAAYIEPTTTLEKRMCSIWQSVLGLKKIGICDDFFRIGGNSILAIKLVNVMNERLSAEVTFSLTDLFTHKTIKKLLDNVIPQNNLLALIKPLSAVVKYSTRQLYFVHPGNGGCEGYADLANTLADRFDCFGIDNYNILYYDNISSLSELARKYISAMPLFDLTQEINLAGWSMGGQLALEMAYELEQKGYHNINIYLLDTLISDAFIASRFNEAVEIDINQQKRDSMIAMGYDQEYVERVIRASSAESDIVKQPISGRLTYSDVLLYKALEADTRIDYEGRNEMYQHILELPDNNIQPFVKNLKIVHLPCHHGNIVEYLCGGNKEWFS
jgi:amino acid adenylation domain-containing protein